MVTRHALISIRLKQDLSLQFEINLHFFGTAFHSVLQC